MWWMRKTRCVGGGELGSSSSGTGVAKKRAKLRNWSECNRAFIFGGNQFLRVEVTSQSTRLSGF